ncbi:MAG TPA: D-glycerate dehydrogenase [Candidatus Cloacimonetes bacterium]|nr:D-glycerate dehydrogenase [Candidatus Cloacimonadota bacterium]
MKPKIFVTRLLPKPAMNKLEEVFDIKVNPEDRVLSKQEIIEGTKWCDILLCLLTDTIYEEILDANPNLKGISNYAVGFNNIDIRAATKRKIPVCNTPGVLTDTTADMTWALIFAAARRIVESDKFNRAGKFKGWGPMLFLGNDIFGKTLGIIGAGRIGTAVAKRAIGFKMKVLYADKSQNNEIERSVGAKKVEFEYLLQQADFVSLHVPLLPETINLISEKELKLMKRSAYLINTSRGPVLDEKVLIKALKENRIAGAGLDVYTNEPEMTEGLAQCENAILTPHTASATIETRTKMGILAAENAIAMIQGKKPKHIINPEVLKP